MTAISRMLGRWRSGGCGCLTPGPDCAGHERDTRRRKRQEKRAVDREIWEDGWGEDVDWEERDDEPG